MAAISEDSHDFLFREERPLGDVRKGFTHFADGDVLFAKITPCMENGKGAVPQHLRNGLGCGTTEVHVIRPLSGIRPLYVYRYLSQSSVRRQAKENFTGTAGQLRVPTEFIKTLCIPVPPSAEQRRIEEKLEKLLAEVEQCKERMTKIPVLLKRFRQSVLAAACSGRLTTDWREVNNKEFDWPMARLADVGEISGGITKNSKRDKMMRQVPYLRVANVYENRILLDEVKIIGVTDQEFSRTRLVKGDVLFVEGNGSIDQIGRVAIWNGSIEGCVHQNHLIKFRSKKSVLPEFVLLSMMASEGRQQLIAKSSSTSGLNTLSISKIEEIELAVAPIDEQREISRRAMELLGFADRVEERYQAAKKQVDSLTQSILAKAFRGELVPTEAELATREGRSFESAEELLGKIKRQEMTTEQDGSQQPSGRGRKRHLRPSRDTKAAAGQ